MLLICIFIIVLYFDSISSQDIREYFDIKAPNEVNSLAIHSIQADKRKDATKYGDLENSPMLLEAKRRSIDRLLTPSEDSLDLIVNNFSYYFY